MRKIFNVLFFICLMSSAVFAQFTPYAGEVVVNVMTDGEFKWGGTTINEAPLVMTDGNRVAARTFLVTDDTLPYNLFTDPCKVYIRVQEWQHMVDDTTLADGWSPRGGSIFLSKPNDRDNAYTFVQFTGALGDSTAFESDITPAIALMRDDFTIYVDLGVWVEIPHFITVDLVFVPDPTAASPFWLHPVMSAGGVQEEMIDSDTRWNGDVTVPADVVNKGLYYFARGTGDDQYREVENKFWVDGEEVYSFEPWIESCEHTLEFNWMLDQNGVDSAWVAAGRSGFCYGAASLATMVTSDALENALTPGDHTVRIMPVDATPNGASDAWTAWYTSAFAYGDEDGAAGAATVIDVVGPTDNFLAHEKVVPINIAFQNAAGFGVHATVEEVTLSGEAGIVFSSDKENWSNPFTTTIKGASGIVWTKGTEGGDYNVAVDVTSGNLANPAPLALSIHENLARIAVATATDSCGDGEAPKYIADGLLNTKWCANHIAPPYAITFGFATPQDLNYFIVYHAGAGGEGSNMNTGDFEIRVHNTATGAWELFDKVEDNFDTEEGNVTYHAGETVNCDSVMMYLITPEANGGSVARVYEFEMYLTDAPYVVGIEDVEALPAEYKVFNNYPNPFNPSTQIQFFTPNQAKVSVDVYNVLGQHITNLLSGDLSAGTHKVFWKGTNRAGSKVAGGVYFYSIRFSDNLGRKIVETRKMLFLP